MIIEHESGKELSIPLEGKYAIMFHLPGHCAGCKVALKVLEGKKLENTTVELIDAGDEANRPLIDLFQATTAPTVIVFENGQAIGRMAGLREFNAKQQELLGD
jgi:glutaredoxin